MMAGYLFTFSDEESMFDSMESGIYSTLMNSSWSNPVAATLADYVTMKPGDNVYFFSNRKIYGIGEIVSVVPESTVIENYPNATSRERVEYAFIRMNSLVEPEKPERVKRWLFAFKPAPYMFANGIDMDDILARDGDAFKSLRVFWKRSFIKLDDQENTAFKSALLQRNLDVIYGKSNSVIPCNHEESMRYLKEKCKHGDRVLDIPGLLKQARTQNGSLTAEMLLEVGLLYQLSQGDERTADIFGKWDYLSHQVHASPMKPIDYMDKIDVFGYRWIKGFEPIVEKYLIVELKKGQVSGEDISQIMKYVDWVRGEYAGDDYSMLKAFLVGSTAEYESLRQEFDQSERRFVIGARPATSCRWQDLSIVTYYVEEDGYINFSLVDL